MRPKESDRADGVQNERVARYEAQAAIAARVGATRDAARFRDLAEGIKVGAIGSEEVIFRPWEGPPSTEWVEVHRKSRRWLVDRATARGERPPPCWPCQSHWGSYCSDITP